MRKLLVKIEDQKHLWEHACKDRERKLKRKLETCQITIEKNQINRDLDLLFKEIDHRKRTEAMTYEQAQQNLKNFHDITENMSICSENIVRWKNVIDTILSKRRNDHEDALQQQELNDMLNQVDTKWSMLHSNVKDYRDALANSNSFCKLYEEVELWVHQKTQIIEKLYTSSKSEFVDIREIDFLITQINRNIDDIKQFNDTKIKHLTQLSVQVYGKINTFLKYIFILFGFIFNLFFEGELEGQNKVKHITTRNIDLLNNFIELKDHSETSRVTLNEKLIENEIKSKQQRTSQIYHDSPMVEPELPPDFVKRLESAIVLTSSSHTFECIVTGTRPFEIKWFKNGIELQESKNFSINFNEDSGSISLVIQNANHNDNALFTCRINNQLGQAETSAFLKVKGKIQSFCFFLERYTLVFLKPSKKGKYF